MGWYEPQQPLPGNERVLACRWTAQPTGRHRLVPDACMDIVVLIAPPTTPDPIHLVLCGPERAAWEFELPTGTEAVGLRFRPGCAAVVFGVDVGPLRDRRVPLADVADPRIVDAASAAVAAAATPDDAALALERALSPLIAAAPVDELAFVDQLTELLVHSPRVPQARLAEAVGLTPRHLHRRLLAVFGHGAALLGRQLRFQRFLAAHELDPSLGSIAELAATAGYADQAHLSRDCRALTGVTVRQFLEDWFPTFPDMSDPFKTSERFLATMTS